MNRSKAADALPQHLRSTFEMIQSAFPRRIETEEYLSLLALLSANMSDRNLADVVSLIFDIDAAQALNDIYRARTVAAPGPGSLEKIRQQLAACGYEKWLHEE